MPPTDQILPKPPNNIPMKIEVNYTQTGTRLPAQEFTISLKELLLAAEKLNMPLENIMNRYVQLVTNTMISVPVWKHDRWKAWIDDANRILNIRFGAEGDPQIIVKEVAA